MRDQDAGMGLKSNLRQTNQNAAAAVASAPGGITLSDTSD